MTTLTNRCSASLAGLCIITFFVVGCGTTQPVGDRGLPQDEGIASYYAGKYAGKPTASGEIFDPSKLTAAHRTLPLGTEVRVTRMDVPGEPAVVVRINDRGPFKNQRIIDLSRAAAQELDMIRKGIVKVRLEVLSYPDGSTASTRTSTDGGSGW